MADEITVTVSFGFTKGGTSFVVGVEDLTPDVAGSQLIHHRHTVTTSEGALHLSGVGAGGWFFAINRDATNFVSIRQGTGATDMIKLLPGECCLFRLHDDAPAPYAIADTATCELEYWLVEA